MPLAVLHQQSLPLLNLNEVSSDLTPTSISVTSSKGIPLSIPTPVTTPRELSPPFQHKALSTSHDHLHLRRWHSNLESRLHPFWAGVLSNRTVRVSVRPHFDLTDAEAEIMSPSELELLEEPLGASAVVTDADGAFKTQFVIHWESLCMHPKGAPIAFVETNREHDFSVTAELMAPPPPPGSPHTPTEPQSLPSSTTSWIPTAITSERVPLTYSPVRVISDIDDTVKLSGIQCGLRAVFQNVFVKDLEDNLISGMGEWYTQMWRRGVRFHYVVSSQLSAPLTTRNLKLEKCRSQTVLSRSFLSLMISSN